jgi:hypothetical protein
MENSAITFADINDWVNSYIDLYRLTVGNIYLITILHLPSGGVCVRDYAINAADLKYIRDNSDDCAAFFESDLPKNGTVFVLGVALYFLDRLTLNIEWSNAVYGSDFKWLKLAVLEHENGLQTIDAEG